MLVNDFAKFPRAKESNALVSIEGPTVELFIGRQETGYCRWAAAMQHRLQDAVTAHVQLKVWSKYEKGKGFLHYSFIYCF